MTWHNPIRSTGVEPCNERRHDTAREAVEHIQALREMRGRRWIAAHCCRCRGWHVADVPKEMGDG